MPNTSFAVAHACKSVLILSIIIVQGFLVLGKYKNDQFHSIRMTRCLRVIFVYLQCFMVVPATERTSV